MSFPSARPSDLGTPSPRGHELMVQYHIRGTRAKLTAAPPCRCTRHLRPRLSPDLIVRFLSGSCPFSRSLFSSGAATPTAQSARYCTTPVPSPVPVPSRPVSSRHHPVPSPFRSVPSRPVPSRPVTILSPSPFRFVPSVPVSSRPVPSRPVRSTGGSRRPLVPFMRPLVGAYRR